MCLSTAAAVLKSRSSSPIEEEDGFFAEPADLFGGTLGHLLDLLGPPAAAHDAQDGPAASFRHGKDVRHLDTTDGLAARRYHSLLHRLTTQYLLEREILLLWSIRIHLFEKALFLFLRNSLLSCDDVNVQILDSSPPFPTWASGVLSSSSRFWSLTMSSQYVKGLFLSLLWRPFLVLFLLPG